ncbi:hypothetical protein LM601614_130010 [Listeria monocytogenes]|nr:hypothetical protein LM601614_130010 [Listeria monocytogenes]
MPEKKHQRYADALSLIKRFIIINAKQHPKDGRMIDILQ